MASTVERFSNRVANYVKYRPAYPKEILKFLQDELRLETSSVITDIGSGTGISAKLFLENGNPVFGVEPNQAMRRAAEEYLKEFPNFKSVEGTAENTSLENESVDFVVAAQAFHWFDKEKTRGEFKRILKNNGYVILMWNERQLETTEFLRDYEQLLLQYGTDYNQVRHENVTAEILGEFFQAEFQKKVFQNHQILDFEGLKGRMLSSSYVPAEESPRFGEMIKTLESLFTKHQKNDTIQISYDTNVFYGIL
jgi:ubiquinone/menaquinone biosynthesis C-methylase UbiE